MIQAAVAPLKRPCCRGEDLMLMCCVGDNNMG